MAKVERVESDGGRVYLFFECPGCKTHHAVPIVGKNGNGAGPWQWNGDVEAPTITPSVLTQWPDASGTIREACHLFVRDGQIEFLSDSYHALKGQTVPMVDWVDELP